MPSALGGGASALREEGIEMAAHLVYFYWHVPLHAIEGRVGTVEMGDALGCNAEPSFSTRRRGLARMTA